MQRVWYVAYGSNLGRARFQCYLSGGTPAGGQREYAGCRDPSVPDRITVLDVPGRLVFGGESGVWGGGMAFYDADGAGRVACRAYLVTAEQFADVAAQEMRRPPGGEFARDLAGLLPDVDLVHAMGPGRYETVARLGEQDGAPMFTVTHDDVAGLEPTAPTAPYLWSIACGLREAHGWTAARIGAYLAGVPGAAGAWTAGEIAAWVADGSAVPPRA
ncbi:histone deacetylase [Nocardioides guangzhouensis]|uniref:histone deacetylase n=1 Tax=Nocardioides guangzhouensis TaxID=2497878 RepID=UPI001588FC34|nr:histone deacetylase [Nocardioides guangzhouensis]